MFKERYEKDSWKILYFDELMNRFSKAKGKTRIEDIFGMDSPSRKKHVSSGNSYAFEQGVLNLEYD
ncbi:hypothetical protein HZA56_07075 [Candidatus Poribacteria bacterium]|nr:hypothetical protein [Candidatus Poribacteria bacterium]